MACPLFVWQVGRADLDVYRHAGSAFLRGDSLYSPAFATHLATHLPFTYPPFAAALATLLLLAPGSQVALLWAVAEIAMLAWCVRVTFARVQARCQWSDLTVVLLTGLLLYTRPVFDHLGDGQVDILLMTLCLADSVTPQTRWPRGVLVGVATAVKLVPGIFIPYLWVTGRLRAAATAVGTFIVCEVLAGLATPRDSQRYWTHLVFDTERPGFTAGYKNQSLRGIGLRILPAPGRTVLLAAIAVLVVLAGLTFARRLHRRGDVVAGATAVGLVGVLASPVSWIHATVWIIPAIGALLDRAARWRVALAVVTVVALYAGLPYIPNVVHNLPPIQIEILRDSFGLICLVYVIALSAARGRPPPAEDD